MFSVIGLSIPVSATELLLASAIFCLVFWVVRAWQPQVPKGLKSPPGPWGWPLLGHILTLRKNPHLVLSQLSQRYGDVLEVRIGCTPVLVLSGLDTIQQALVRQGDDFKGRPDLYSFTFIGDGQSLTFNPDSGPVWAARRRLAQNALKSFSTASDPASSSSCYLEEHVSKEAEALISKFQELMAGAGCFDHYNQVVVSVAKVIGAMCFGQHFPHSSEEMLSLVKNSHDFVETASSGNPVDFFPILKYLPNPSLQRFKAFNQRFVQFLKKMTHEHYQNFDKVSPACGEGGAPCWGYVWPLSASPKVQLMCLQGLGWLGTLGPAVCDLKPVLLPPGLSFLIPTASFSEELLKATENPVMGGGGCCYYE